MEEEGVDDVRDRYDPVKAASAIFSFCTASAGRVIIDKDGFHISYNPHLPGGAETAVVFHDDDGAGWFLILMGDHRELYADVETLRQAADIFKEASKTCRVSLFSDSVTDAVRALSRDGKEDA